MVSCKELLQCLQQMLTNTQQQAEAFESVSGVKLLWRLSIVYLGVIFQPALGTRGGSPINNHIKAH